MSTRTMKKFKDVFPIFKSKLPDCSEFFCCIQELFLFI
jgi:hypothetical protein